MRHPLLPLAIPLVVLALGSWRLASEPSNQTATAFAPAAAMAPAPGAANGPSVGGARVLSRPDYTVPPAAVGRSCRTEPAIAQELLREGQRLGVRVLAAEPELPGKDGSYRAEHGRLGTIRLRQRPMSAEVRCLLISHEFIHVLQHLHGGLKGVPTLGWGPGSDQEAEAYAHQNQAGHVLQLLRATPSTHTTSGV